MARRLGQIYVELTLDDSKFRDGLTRTRTAAENAGKGAENAGKGFGDHGDKVKYATAAHEGLANKTLETTKNLLAAAPGFAVATAAIAGFYQAIRAVRDEFTAGLGVVEDYNVKVASMTAFMTTFSKKTKEGDLSGAFVEANAYSKELVKTLEILDARTIATGHDLTIMAEGFLKGGIQIDINNKKAMDGFVNLATALKLLTAGQNQEIQMRQEIRGLIQGQSKDSNVLFKTLESIDPKIKEHWKIWRAQGTELENINGLLKGFGASGSLLQATWATIGTTIETIHTRVLRDAFTPTYQKLISLAVDFNSKFMDSSGQLTEFAQRVASEVGKSASSFADLIGYFAKMMDYLPEILSTIHRISGFLFKGGLIYIGLSAITALFGKTILLSEALGLSIYANEVAIGRFFMVMNAGLKLSLALVAGYQFGKWLSDNFEIARLAGVMFVDYILKGWTYLEYGAAVAWENISYKWNSIIATMKDGYAGFLLFVADGLRKVPALSNKAGELEAYANGIQGRGDLDTRHKKSIDSLNKGLDENLKKHNYIIDAMVKEAIVGEKIAKKTSSVIAPELVASQEIDKKAARERESAREKLRDLADSLRVKTAALDQSKASEVAAILSTEDYQKALKLTGDEGKKMIGVIMGLAIAFDKAKADEDALKKREKLLTKETKFIKTELDHRLKENSDYFNTESQLLEAQNNANLLLESQYLEKKRNLQQQELQNQANLIGTAISDYESKLQSILDTDVGMEEGGLFDKTFEEANTLSVQLDDIIKKMGLLKKIAIIEDSKDKDWVSAANKSLEKYGKDATNIAKQVGDVFEQAFKGMEDALFNFVKNGKINFNDLANSIVDSLIRISIQESITGPLAKGISTSGIMSSIGSGVSSLFGFANGAAFNGISGLSNQIVSSPTMFSHSGIAAFANGGGVLGEAGPEAIMPLQRTSGGKLGVIASGGSTPNVTVNVIESPGKGGTSNQRETPQGLEIDIMVDQLVAKKQSQRGSASNKAMRQNFGAREVLVAR